jgi:hypothetical protein
MMEERVSECVPVAAFLLPLHEPPATQVSAFVTAQVSTEEPPLARIIGFAVSETLGSGGRAETETVAVPVVVPPGPTQVSVYDLFAVSGPVLSDPDTPFVPLQSADAVHEVALVVHQYRVDEKPLYTVVGDA